MVLPVSSLELNSQHQHLDLHLECFSLFLTHQAMPVRTEVISAPISAHNSGVIFHEYRN